MLRQPHMQLAHSRATTLKPCRLQLPRQSCSSRAAMAALEHSQQRNQRPCSASTQPAAAAAREPAEEAAAAAAGVAQAPAPFSLVSQSPLAGGTLNFVCLEGRRMLRVWTPPGYSREAGRTYPLLLLNDGQNCFEDATSFSGHSWRAAETAAAAIAAGELPPFLVAGIDHAGVNRSLEFLPYKPGSGPGGFRSDAANWPGGGVAAYMRRVEGEILPWLQQRYGAATDPRHLCFGGSSFGGIVTLWAAMHSSTFGAALVESPSLWFADERFLRDDLPAYSGPWPQRVYLAMGSAEYSGTRGGEASAASGGARFDTLLVGYCRQLAALLAAQGVGPDRLLWEVDEGAAHTESAWAARLPRALRWLGAQWRDGS